jgi:quercetin dioxygenase-like cupin family protein
MRRPATFAWIAIGAGIALAVMTPASVHATPSTGVSAVPLSKQTVDGKDYIVSDITIAPGGSTGWHTHRGEIYGVMKSRTPRVPTTCT